MVIENYRVVPMKLFATWEVDRTSPNCVPRLCTMTLNRLTVLKPLDSEINCLVIALKLQGFRRTLRSNDLIVDAVNGIIDIDLNISFTIQYPHFVKRKNNCVQLLLQRRKKYKNRPIPGGFKTIAVGTINLTNVLQGAAERELPMYSYEGKEEGGSGSVSTSTSGQSGGGGMGPGTSGGSGTPQATGAGQQQVPVAKLYMVTCSSQPIEHDEASVRKEKENEPPSDEEEDTADPDSGSDSDPVTVEDPEGQVALMKRPAKGFRFTPGRFGTASTSSSHRHQKNFKQKFLTLLKKFKISEEALTEVGESLGSVGQTKEDIDKLMEELENLSESGPELEQDDALSIHSTPKPGLQPFFPPSTRSSREALPEFSDPLTTGGGGSEESRESEVSQAELDMGTDQEYLESSGSPSRKHQILARAQQEPTVTPPTTAREKEPLRMAATAPCTGSSEKDKRKRFQTKESKHTSADQIMVMERPCVVEGRNMVQAPGGSWAGSGTGSVGRLKVGPLSTGQPGQVSPKLHQEIPPLKHAPVSEQIAQRICPEDASAVLPDSLWILSAFDVHCQGLVSSLRERQPRILLVSTPSDIRTVFSTLVNRIQKFCNTNSSAPRVMRICLIGGERYLSYCLKSYTESFAQRPTDWQNYVRFVLVTPMSSCVSRCLASLDPTFAKPQSQFTDNLWREWWEKTDLTTQDVNEISNRIQKYVLSAKATMPMPIAEAMLQTRDKGAPDENSQVFVPFILECRLGSGVQEGVGDANTPSFPAEVGGAAGTAQTVFQVPGATGPQQTTLQQVVSPPNLATSAGSPPSSSGLGPPPGRPGGVDTQPGSAGSHGSPPASPNIGAHHQQLQGSLNFGEARDLQIEYWATPGLSGSHGAIGVGKGEGQSGGGTMVSGVGGGKKEGGLMQPSKYSVKSAFKSLAITRLPHQPSQASCSIGDPTPTLSLHYTKEKKKDKMLQKLGMKNKEKGETEQRSQNVDGISRLICSTKHSTIRVCIDGVEWSNVKFFQISSQWQTHVKHFPVALYHGD